MNYFVTGATGFIGKRLVKRLIEQKRKGTIYFLIRESSLDKVPELQKYWGAKKGQCVPVVGDLTKPKLGLKATEIKELNKNIAHFFTWQPFTIWPLMRKASRKPTSKAPRTQWIWPMQLARAAFS